jgi:hypothetical protein
MLSTKLRQLARPAVGYLQLSFRAALVSPSKDLGLQTPRDAKASHMETLSRHDLVVNRYARAFPNPCAYSNHSSTSDFVTYVKHAVLSQIENYLLC